MDGSIMNTIIPRPPHSISSHESSDGPKSVKSTHFSCCFSRVPIVSSLFLLIHSNYRFSFSLSLSQYLFSMCGRFACSLCPYELQTTLRSSDVAVSDKWNDEDYFHPSYNVAPRKWIPVVRYADNDLILHTMASESFIHRKYSCIQVTLSLQKWGFIPSWAKKTPDNQVE